MKKSAFHKTNKTGQKKSRSKLPSQNTSITEYTVSKPLNNKCEEPQNGLDEANKSISCWRKTAKFSVKLRSPIKLRSHSHKDCSKELIQTSLLTQFSAHKSKRIFEAAQKKIDIAELIKQLQVNEKVALEIRELPDKGRAIFTTQEFKCGDYICEYIGSLISFREALYRETEYSEDVLMGCYMYYFKHKGAKYCIDATEETGKFGRLINHSRLRFNMKSRVVVEGDVIHLCFIATRNLKIGEELLYDYGDRSRESIKNFPWLKT
ncbi:N-lysine methyltransferase SETD8-B-like [Oopsacas minuta]|uniref:N-lysine methyltransferase SETD8-B-like n=1 Tax=Oopsacas minuta TaxID=111878 RepID=A0AAV7K917_9METZ|nr:N-lysine methyltransferase SETD8-B-like [Oopsacas minuta]